MTLDPWMSFAEVVDQPTCCGRASDFEGRHALGIVMLEERNGSIDDFDHESKKGEGHSTLLAAESEKS